VAVFSALAQGMAAGDQIGIPALEGSVHRLQRSSHIAIFTALVLDVLAGILIAPWIPGQESTRSNLRVVLNAMLGVTVTSIATGALCRLFLAMVGFRYLTGFF
jgi:hypothetical protein